MEGAPGPRSGVWAPERHGTIHTSDPVLNTTPIGLPSLPIHHLEPNYRDGHGGLKRIWDRPDRSNHAHNAG
jgi:hypothetical protein